jgi:hypothetical protein
VKTHRYYKEYPPNKDNEDELDGVYWCSCGDNTFDDYTREKMKQNKISLFDFSMR